MTFHPLTSHRDEPFADRWLPRLLASGALLLALLVPFGSARAALLASATVPFTFTFTNFPEPGPDTERMRLTVAGELMLDTGYATGDTFTVQLTSGNAFNVLVNTISNGIVDGDLDIRIDHDNGTAHSAVWGMFQDWPTAYNNWFQDFSGIPIGGIVLRLHDTCLDTSSHPSVDPCGFSTNPFGPNTFGNAFSLTMEVHDSAFQVPTPGTLSLAGLALLAASAVRRRQGRGRVRDNGV